MKAFRTFLIFLYAFVPVAALASGGGDTLSVRIHFAKSSSEVDSAFSDNAEALRRLEATLGSDKGVASVTVRGSASPEGTRSFNDRLAAARTAAASELCGHLEPMHDGADIDWTLLGEMIERSGAEWSGEAVSIISKGDVARKTMPADSRVYALRNLRGGRAWKYMTEHIFPAMRYAECTLALHPAQADGAETLRKLPDGPALSDNKEVDGIVRYTDGAADASAAGGGVGDAGQTGPAMQAGSGGGVKLALKTNLLYDAALIPNLGLELEFARNWSASVNWMYAWWSKSARHRFWRVYGGDAEVRRYWRFGGKDCSGLTGHHAGVYYQMLTYDIEFGNRGYQGDRWSHAVGLSYGYSVGLSRYFNLDFTIGVGYLWGEYKKYHVEDDCYVWGSTSNRRWIGPTKAEISLVYVIGGKCGRKGGSR